MTEQVGLSEYLLAEIHEALRLGVTITGLPVGLRELKVSPEFAVFLQSILAAMFVGVAERAQDGCRVHVQMEWDTNSIELTFADDGGPFHNAQESPAALELSRLREMIMANGGSLEWYLVGGPWHTMQLNMPIPPF